MSDTLAQFQHSTQRLHASPWVKLLRPGAHKFLVRWWARCTRPGLPITTRLFFGPKMRVVLPEVVSEALYTYGLFDEVVTDLVIRYVKPGDTVLDIGAHFGYLSLLCSHLVGPEGQVYAFEPTPSTFAVLEENTARYANTKAFNLAAGRENTRQKILDHGLQYCAWNTLAPEPRMPGLVNGTKIRKTEVTIVKLDDFLQARGIVPSFVKIDTENFEADVISGLNRTLKITRPRVLLEAGSSSSLEAAETLSALGYRLYVAQCPGAVEPWIGTLAEANSRFKDILFLP